MSYCDSADTKQNHEIINRQISNQEKHAMCISHSKLLNENESSQCSSNLESRPLVDEKEQIQSS